MILKLLAQFVLATSALQLFPADAAQIQERAGFPVTATHASGFSQTAALLQKPLPLAQAREKAPHKVLVSSLGVVTSAVSAAVVDRGTGMVLFEKNGEAPRSMGSVTKLMSAFVFLETQPDLESQVMLVPEDMRMGGVQHVGLSDGVRLHDLLSASLIGSDNTSTAALVRLSRLPEGDFVARMNERAAEFGMRHTTYVDPTGLSQENRSTALDIAILLDHVLREPAIREATSSARISFSGASGRTYVIENTNELLGTLLDVAPYDVVGGKTGFLPAAGYCLGAVFSEQARHEIAVVVLGSATKEERFADVKALALWAYKVFDWPDE